MAKERKTIKKNNKYKHEYMTREWKPSAWQIHLVLRQLNGNDLQGQLFEGVQISLFIKIKIF